jgi:hypothetical protein
VQQQPTPRKMRTFRFATLLLLLGSVISTAALAADKALSLSQYIDTLQQLRQSVVSSADSPSASSIAQNLPPEWQVESAGRVFTVSTSAIGQSLREYAKQRTSSNLAEVTSQLDLLLSNARGMQSTKTNMSAERAKLAEILSRREFGGIKGESWYDRLKRAVQRWLAHLLERVLYSSAFPVVSRIVIWVLLAIAVAVAAFWVIRSYRQSNIYTKFTGSPDAVSAKPWHDWQAEAQAAAQEGRWREAVHLSYWAAISFLEGQGLWRPDLARTPREYLKLLPQDDTHRDPLQQLTRSFEKVWYGTDSATAETFAGASALLERLGCR